MFDSAFSLLLPEANFIYAYQVSGFLSGKLIIWILFGASTIAWTVMVSKALEIRQAERVSKRFVAAFRREAHPLGLFVKRQASPESPLYKVYESACLAIGVEMEARSGEADLFHKGLDPSIKLSILQISAVRNAAERQIADQALQLEGKMGLLATAVSTSPLLGLLGTVWGVLDAFSQMALQGSANISAMAPGIASALLTTVVGLLVALPSAIGYNFLISRIRALNVQMDNFADEMLSEVQRTFVRD